MEMPVGLTKIAWKVVNVKVRIEAVEEVEGGKKKGAQQTEPNTDQETHIMLQCQP